MIDYANDNRIVLTLDAGGTNFVFSAIQGGNQIVEPVLKEPHSNDLNKCLEVIVNGFTEVKNRVKGKPVAISFAFPGPADYPKGIIGDLPNLPAFKGGVALGNYLEEKFKLPVYINNDGDLFAYGEALAGMLISINKHLKEAGSKKRYHNLIGITLGTGFGAGVVSNNQLLIGDNSIAMEVWLMSNRVNTNYNAEEIVSARSIIAEYLEKSGSEQTQLMPLDIYEIATGKKPGDKEAALEAFNIFGRGLGDIIGNLITLFDGIIVIGGGITKAQKLYMPSALKELKTGFVSRNYDKIERPIQTIFNYEDEEDRVNFLQPLYVKIKVPESKTMVVYDAKPRLAISHSELGASKAIQLGAYVFALNKLNSTTRFDKIRQRKFQYFNGH